MGIPTRFTVRVYGFLRTPEQEVLITQELIHGMDTVKLPGGGVEFGEGLREALQREFQEEAGIHVQVTQHLYTSDIYTQSAFDPEAQVIGIYYLVEAEKEIIAALRASCQRSIPGSEMHLVLHPISQLSPGDFTFEIDRLAVRAFLQTVRQVGL